MKRPTLFLLSLLSFLSFSFCLVQSAVADSSNGTLDFTLPSASTVAVPIDTAQAEPDTKTATTVLSFAPPPAPSPPPLSPTPLSPPTPTPAPDRTDLFAGGSESLVARTIGHAEGTRGADGSRNRAYYGHIDPGNGVWNLGSFSFQHCQEAHYNCSTPEEADVHQLQRLQRQARAIQQKAAAAGLQLSLEEELNAIDLANQAPLAALDTPGYIEWLKQAHQQGLSGSDAVLWARTQSYWNPKRNRWEASGLGNSEDRISHDQNRRLTAIARAMDWYQRQEIAQRQSELERQDKVAQQPPQEQRADQIIFQNLSPPQRPVDQVALSIPQ